MAKTSQKTTTKPGWVSAKPVGGMALALVLLVVGVWGVRAAPRWRAGVLRHHAGVKIALDQIGRPIKPAWLTDDPISASLAEAADPDGKFNLLDPTLLERLGRRLEQSPWVAQVNLTRAHRRLHIEAKYREPVLCVVFGQDGCYLDLQGIVLPAAEAATEALKRCVVVTGVSPAAPPEVGRQFADRRITTAAEIAGLLAPYRSRLGIAELRVRTQEGEPFACDLHTLRQTVVIWGTHPDRQLSPQDKLARLLRFADRQGGLDVPQGPSLLDVSQHDLLPARERGVAAEHSRMPRDP